MLYAPPEPAKHFEALERAPAIGWSEGAGGVHQSNDLVGRKDARCGTFVRAHQPRAGHVDVALGGADHREKPAHDAQPPRVLAFGARRGPLDGDLRNREYCLRLNLLQQSRA